MKKINWHNNNDTDNDNFSNINSDTFCNNCGKIGHSFHQCKLPITSNGVIVFRINPIKKRENI